jgi:polysaccharide deacetylase family protein (PEP-CTERM system associated)
LPPNALTVDVEDYFQVSAFEKNISRDQWDEFPPRVEQNTDRILALFSDNNVNATFFVLGWIAERHPELIRRIAAAGHEIASHGHSHVRVHEQSPAQFREDVTRTRKILEDTTGTAVLGYRAASFSIAPEMAWAYEILGETGHRYSSSVYPIRHDLYGAPRAARFPFRPLEGAAIAELPISTVAVAGKRFPCGGGGYFRLFPYAYSRWALRRIQAHDRRPAMFYFHPWEIDPDQPRVPGLSGRSRFRHYTNLKKMVPKLHRLLDDFAWDRVDRVFASEIAK